MIASNPLHDAKVTWNEAYKKYNSTSVKMTMMKINEHSKEKCTVAKNKVDFVKPFLHAIAALTGLWINGALSEMAKMADFVHIEWYEQHEEHGERELTNHLIITKEISFSLAMEWKRLCKLTGLPETRGYRNP